MCFFSAIDNRAFWTEAVNDVFQALLTLYAFPVCTYVSISKYAKLKTHVTYERICSKGIKRNAYWLFFLALQYALT